MGETMAMRVNGHDTYHVTRIHVSGDIVECYGHDTATCDPSGCAGLERYLGAIAYDECPERSRFYARPHSSSTVRGFLEVADQPAR